MFANRHVAHTEYAFYSCIHRHTIPNYSSDLGSYRAVDGKS